jgi:hypothetical protein
MAALAPTLTGAIATLSFGQRCSFSASEALGGSNDAEAYAYLPQVLAFSLVIAAVLLKNRRRA